VEQFVIIAFDGNDAEALTRRLGARPGHLQNVGLLKAKGQFTEGGAMLDNAGNMIGSVMIVSFPSRSDLDEWLKSDPYVTGKVWERTEIWPYRSAKV
jgi:uncharacterized protein YciI